MDSRLRSFSVAVILFFIVSATAGAQCIDSDTTLCLNEGRFEIRADWRTATGQIGSAHGVQLTAETGYFWFFQETNVEMVVKVLDACSGFSHFWVFAGGLTNVEVRYTVKDLWSGEVRSYSNAQGSPFQPLQDTAAFSTCGVPAPSHIIETKKRPVIHYPIFRKAASNCVSNQTSLCLNRGRFQVQTRWRTANDSGDGMAVQLTEDTGYFWFFKDTNVEMVVKVLDACGGYGHFWVFAGGLTNVEVDWVVTDTVTGDVRTYTNAQGAKFQPVQDVAAFKTCDALVPPQIRFVGDSSVALVNSGATADLHVEVRDEHGQPVPGATVTWQSSNPAAVSVSGNGLLARLTAQTGEAQAAEITATYLGASVTGTAFVVHLAPGARWVPSAWILRHSVGFITLIDSPSTELIQVGNVLVSGDSFGLLHRVIEKTLVSGEVRLKVVPATLVDAYDALAVDSTSSVRGAAVLQNSPRNGASAATFDCRADAGGAIGEVRGPAVDVRLNLDPRLKLTIDSGGVKELQIGAAGQIDLVASAGSAVFEPGVQYSYRCVRRLPLTHAGLVPVAPGVFLTLELAPKVGFEVTGGITSTGAFSIAGPNGTGSGLVEVGVHWTRESGWSSFGRGGWEGTMSPGEIIFQPHVGVDAAVAATAGVGLMVGLKVGPALPVAGVEIATIEGRASFHAKLAANPGQESLSYVGPTWTIEGSVAGGLEAEVEGEAFRSLLRELGVDLELHVEFSLFNRSTTFAKSPVPVISYSPSFPRVGNIVSLVASAEGGQNGRVQFWARENGAEPLQLLAQGSFSDGHGEATWQMTKAAQYEVVARLSADKLSEVLPYASQTPVILGCTADGDLSGEWDWVGVVDNPNFTSPYQTFTYPVPMVLTVPQKPVGNTVPIGGTVTVNYLRCTTLAIDGSLSGTSLDMTFCPFLQADGYYDDATFHAWSTQTSSCGPIYGRWGFILGPNHHPGPPEDDMGYFTLTRRRTNP